MKNIATIGQIQWMMFFIALIEPEFLIVWIASLFLTRHNIEQK